MLVEVFGKNRAEHMLSQEGVASRARFHIQRLAALHGVTIGEVAVHKKDEEGRIVESVQVRRDPVEPSFASVVRPNFSLLAKVVPGGASTIEFIPVSGISYVNSVEADQELGKLIP